MVMSILRGLLAFAVIFGLGYAISADRKAIRYKSIIILLVLMFVVAFIGLQTSIGITVLNGVSAFFNWLMEQAAGGVDFVFGGIMIEEGASVFFFDVLLPIVFLSALIGILNYILILPWLMKGIGWLINKITGMGELESFTAIATAIFGQPTSYQTIRDKMDVLTENQVFYIGLTGLSSVTATTLGAYMQLIDGRFVVIAVVLNIFSAMIISSLMNPYDPNADSGLIPETKMATQKEPFFEMLGNYINSGFQIAIAVAATLIGFMALITFLNSSFNILFGITFIDVMGYIFSPIAYLMGIPAADIVSAGGIMASKLVANEFVGLTALEAAAGGLTEKTYAMLGTYLISFANFGTLGMIIGGMKPFSEKHSEVFTRNAMKLILGATMASFLTASVVGFFF